MRLWITVRLMALLAVLALMPFAAPAQPAAPPKALDKGPELEADKDYYALIVTNMGNIAVKLYADKTPMTVRNFVNLAEGTREFRDPNDRKIGKRPYFNGVTFHRVIPEFMIQGGDPTGSGAGDPGYKFQDEFVADINFDRPGLLAMANSGPATNGSQFFITEKETPWLNQKHTIFGEILQGTDGLDLVKTIARVKVGANNKPAEPVVMERVQIFRLAKGTDAAAAKAAVMAGISAAAPAAPKAPEAPKVEEKKEEAAPAETK